MTTTPSSARRSDRPEVALEGLEARVALRVANRLNESAESLPHDITERLRFGREQALARARVAHAPVVAPPAMALARSGAAATLAGGPSVWLRLASLLPLLVLAAGLVLIQAHREHEQITAAAEIDAALLTDELPPAAYGDPGFVEYLRSSEMP